MEEDCQVFSREFFFKQKGSRGSFRQSSGKTKAQDLLELTLYSFASSLRYVNCREIYLIALHFQFLIANNIRKVDPMSMNSYYAFLCSVLIRLTNSKKHLNFSKFVEHI